MSAYDGRLEIDLTGRIMTITATYEDFERVLNNRFCGVLTIGKHNENGCACVLECAAIARIGKWTDSPNLVQLPDLRSLNDSYAWTDDTKRTLYMCRLVKAFWDWHTISETTKLNIMQRIIFRFIKEVLPLSLRVTGHIAYAEKCEQVETLEQARAAADAAYAAAAAAYVAAAADADAAAYVAAYVAAAAADAAAYAAAAADAATAAAAYAAAAAAAAAESILIKTCEIWIEEKDETIRHLSKLS